MPKNMMRFIQLFILILPGLVISQSIHRTIYNADQFYLDGDYHNAMENYLVALNDSSLTSTSVYPYAVDITSQKNNTERSVLEDRKVPLKDYLHHQLGHCYVLTDEYKHAVEHLAVSKESSFYPDDLFHYANALKSNEQFEEAFEVFEEFITKYPDNDSLLRAAKLGQDGCFYAMDPTSYFADLQVWKADSSLNTGTSNFAVSYFDGEDKITFTSAREGGVTFSEDQVSAYLCDVYWAEKSNNQWGQATNFGRPLNSAKHDGAAWAINNKVYFTRWSDENRFQVEIAMGRMLNMRFFEALVLGEQVNLPGYQSKHPFITSDGQWLYFSSNRPGGKGGFDLWVVKLDETGLPTGEPRNLDYPINSELDEITPFYHEGSSTLFFSSNGYNTIGGFDVFRSQYSANSESFSTPENMGFPINSAKDDAYMIWDKDLMNGFLSSDREPCEGAHCFDIYEVSNAPIKIILKGNTYEKYTDEILTDVTVTFKDVHGETFKEASLQTNEVGYYELEIPRGIELFAKAKKQGYFADAGIIDTRKIVESTTLTHDFYLEKIPSGEIEIEGIEYDFNSAKLRPISMEILDKLVEFLELNDNITVEINSHTDTRGSDEYNLKLSERRAKSCVDYLIEKGISRDRLIPRGYGETQPNIHVDANRKPVLDENGNPVLITDDLINAQATKDEKEALHQRNRRTAFKVTGENFNLKSNL